MSLSNEISGFVLAGGKSSRLGEEKGLALFDERPLVSYSLHAIKPLCSKVYVSANDKLDEYAKFGYEIIEDEVKGIGPMGGILACLKRSETKHNIILSCDTPFVKEELFRHLLAAIQSHQAAIPCHNKLLEPLCAVYSASALPELERYVTSGNYKLHSFLKTINTLKVDINPSLPFFQKNLFANINTAGELKQYHG